MHETQVVQGVALVPDDNTPEILQPGEETFHFQSPPVAAQRTAILGLGTRPAPTVGRDHLNAQLQERRVQGVSIIAAVPDHSAGEVIGFQDPFICAVSHPALEPPMAGPVWRVSVRKIGPLGTCS